MLRSARWRSSRPPGRPSAPSPARRRLRSLTRLRQPRAAAPVSRYGCGCAANDSQQGIETTRVRIPSSASISAATRQLQLRAGGDEDQVGLRAAPSASPARRPAHSRRGRTPSVGQLAVPGRTGSFWRVRASADRAVAPLDGEPPGGDGLVGVAGPDEPQVGHRPQRRVVLDRLVGRPVLAEADRVVRPDVDHVQPGRAPRAGPSRACSR